MDRKGIYRSHSQRRKDQGLGTDKMSTVLETPNAESVRQTPRYANNAATELGGGEGYLVGSGGSEEFADEEITYGSITLQPPRPTSTTWWTTLWYTFRHARNEWVHLANLEATEDQIGFPAQATASATEWAQLWKHIETFIEHVPLEVRTGLDPALGPSKTELGRKLREIRARYLARGGELLTAEEIDREVAERRGEQYPEEE